jgi:predicted nicotinamide N-methyase
MTAEETEDRPLPFAAAELRLEYPGHSLRLLCPDPGAVLAKVGHTGLRGRRGAPYWAEHWPAADVLARYLAARALPETSRVLDLGCGLGVLSSLHAGRRMVSCDISLDSCEFTFVNVIRNGGTARVCCADWRRPPFTRVFDLVVAADILYERGWTGGVLDCLETVLAPGGRAWIADPRREEWDEFKRASRSRGFFCEPLTEETVNTGLTHVEVVEIGRP